MLKRVVKDSYHTLTSLYRMIRAERGTIHIPEQRKESIFIVANGPSVREQIDKYPDMCVNRDVMCMNYIANADFYEKLKPRHYIIADINDFTPDDVCSPELVAARTEGLNNIIAKTAWKMSFYVPSFARENKNFYEKLTANNNIDVKYFRTNMFEGFDKLKYYFYSKGLAIPGAQTVLIPAIFLAIIMGYKNIYLFGAEHSWMKDIRCDENNRVYMHDEHSYGTIKRYLYKDAFGKIPSTMYDELSSVANAFYEHNEVQKFAKYLGTNIYNVTPESYIDTYERKKIEDIF